MKITSESWLDSVASSLGTSFIVGNLLTNFNGIFFREGTILLETMLRFGFLFTTELRFGSTEDSRGSLAIDSRSDSLNDTITGRTSSVAIGTSTSTTDCASEYSNTHPALNIDVANADDTVLSNSMLSCNVDKEIGSVEEPMVVF